MPAGDVVVCSIRWGNHFHPARTAYSFLYYAIQFAPEGDWLAVDFLSGLNDQFQGPLSELLSPNCDVRINCFWMRHGTDEFWGGAWGGGQVGILGTDLWPSEHNIQLTKYSDEAPHLTGKLWLPFVPRDLANDDGTLNDAFDALFPDVSNALLSPLFVVGWRIVPVIPSYKHGTLSSWDHIVANRRLRVNTHRRVRKEYDVSFYPGFNPS